MTTSALFLLRKVLLLEGSSELSHQWIWEQDRWKELVIALLGRVATVPAQAIRDIADELHALDLLQPSLLAKLNEDETHLDDSVGARVLASLVEGGMSEEEAKSALAVLKELGIGVEHHCSGKIQRYLRQHGEAMLSELSSMFTFSRLPKEQSRTGFTLWLQNALGMPLSLRDSSIDAFSAHHGITSEQLYEAADELDVNFAVVDDIIHPYMARRSGMQSGRAGNG